MFSEAARAADGADSPQLDGQELRRRLEEAERMVQEQRLVIEASTGGTAHGRAVASRFTQHLHIMIQVSHRWSMVVIGDR